MEQHEEASHRSICCGIQITCSTQCPPMDPHRNMLMLLDPCEQLAKNISKATATSADVIPSTQAPTRLLKQTVPTDQGVKTSKDTLLNPIQTRFGHIEACSILQRYWTRGTRTATSALLPNDKQHKCCEKSCTVSRNTGSHMAGSHTAVPI